MTGTTLPPPTVPIQRPSYPSSTRATPRPERPNISRLPYLPGLDGLRAVAVVAVMIYHANVGWLSGGFLGVEVFFVISGYLITLLLVSEYERSERVSLGNFWLRRAKRLLPALFTMMALLTIYTAFFKSEELGKLRGDVVAGFFYVTNWFQIWSGAGYTGSEDFAPLRHLWSLAVEEQFYLIWPVIMAALLVRKGRRITNVAGWFVIAALVVTVVMAVAYYPGQIETADASPGAFWEVGGRSLNRADTLYLNTITRSTGLLLGAAFAMVWRPMAVMRGPVREKGPLVDLLALGGLLGLAGLAWSLHIVGDDLRADALLFRGGFLLTGLCTLLVIAAATHGGAITGRLIGNPVFRWVGTRSYGLYLYHWPIYQIIRGRAGAELTVAEFAGAMVATAIITELSYQFVEMPIRNGQAAAWWQRMRSQRDPTPRRAFAMTAAAISAVMLFAGVNLATAKVEPNDIEQSIAKGEEHTFDPFADESDDPGDPGEGGSGAGGPVDEAALPPDGETVTATSDGDDPPPPASDPQSPPTTGGGQKDNGQTNPNPNQTNPNQTNPDQTNPGGNGPTTTTTAELPPNAIRRYALGDSVMKGAAGSLSEYGFDVDADVSRAFSTGLDNVRYLHDENRLGNIVVVHLGYNDSTITAERLDEMMNLLSGVDQVLVVTVRLDRSHVYPLNDEIRRLPERHQNVKVLDWAEVGNACPGDCFASDSFHLNADGADFYAQEIAKALGIN